MPHGATMQDKHRELWKEFLATHPTHKTIARVTAEINHAQANNNLAHIEPFLLQVISNATAAIEAPASAESAPVMASASQAATVEDDIDMTGAGFGSG